MPSRHEILCIKKSDRFNAHERILSIGGQNNDRSRWSLSQEDAVTGIQNGNLSFFVQRGGRTVNVLVATSRFGNKYLKTEADGEQPDNLLSLPECT